MLRHGPRSSLSVTTGHKLQAFERCTFDGGIGRIGLGIIEREMASHLLAAGHNVRAFDVDPKTVDTLRLKGLK
jgi:hypothetical protein